MRGFRANHLTTTRTRAAHPPANDGMRPAPACWCTPDDISRPDVRFWQARAKEWNVPGGRRGL